MSPVTKQIIDLSKAPVKGSLSNLANPSEQLIFQYNPPQIKESKEVNWVEVAIPGADDSVAQFGSGQSLTLELQLFFNQMGEVSPDGTDDYVEKQLQFLHRFTETEESRDPRAGLSPNLLIFTFGEIVFGTGSGYGADLAAPGMVVRVSSLSTTRTFFQRQTLKSRRATADISLTRHVRFPR